MKKKSLLLFFTLLILIACGQLEPLTFKTLTINKEAALIPEKKEYKPNIKINLKFVYPESFRDAKSLKQLQQMFQVLCLGKEYGKYESPQAAVDAYTKSYISDYRTETAEDFLNDVKEGVYEEAMDYRYSQEIEIKDSIIFHNSSLVSFTVYNYSYLGGAHGVYGTQLKSIDLNTFKLITPNDIFIDGYKNNLDKIVRSKLLGLMEKRTEENRDVCKTYFFKFDEIESNKNFFITQTGVQFTYNIYEIAPYIAGQFDVKIPYKELKDLLDVEVMKDYFGESFIENIVTTPTKH